MGDAVYRADHDLTRNQVLLHMIQGSRREPPPLAYLPRFVGLRVSVAGPHGSAVLRERGGVDVRGGLLLPRAPGACLCGASMWWPMPLSLYDPSSKTKQVLQAEQSALLQCGAIEGAPKALGALRQAVINDVLQRVLPFHEYDSNNALSDALRAFARDELGDSCEAEALRYLSLTTHYRAPLELEHATDEAGSVRLVQLAESERQLAYLYATQKRVLDLPPERVLPVETRPSEALGAFPDALSEALEDDLDTPRALSQLSAFLLAVNAMCDGALRKQGRVNASAVESAQAGFATIRGMLGLGADDPTRLLRRVRDRRARQQKLDLAAVEQKVAQRWAARAAKDFALADSLQAELVALGIVLMDGPHETAWTLA